MLNKDDVRYIAGLARIHIPEGELEGFTKNLENIIGYVDQLSELKVDNIEPTSHVLHESFDLTNSIWSLPCPNRTRSSSPWNPIRVPLKFRESSNESVQFNSPRIT